jgi:cell division protease FtsH
VARLLRSAETEATVLLKDHRVALDRLTALLLEHETVDGDAIRSILREAPAVSATLEAIR